MKKLVSLFVALAAVLCILRIADATVWTQIPVDSNSPTKYLLELPVNDSSTLVVASATTLSSSLTQSGGVVSLSSTTINGNATTTTLTVTGATTLQNSLTQSGGVASLASTTINGQATTTNLTVNQQVNIPWTTDATGTTANTTVTFGASGERQTMTITTGTVFSVAIQSGWQGLFEVCQDTTGARNYSFVATSTGISINLVTTTIAWPKGTAPSVGSGQTATANHCDDFTFYGKPSNINTASSVVRGQYGNNDFPF